VNEYHHWRSAFGEALDPRYYSLEWLDWMVASGRAMIFFATDCALIAELRYYPTGARDVLVICTAGSPKATIEKLAPMLETWGRAEGCIAIMGESRQAWTRLLKAVGWEQYKTGMRKDLTDG